MEKNENVEWRRIVNPLLVLVLGILLTACNFPGISSEPSLTPEPSKTQISPTQVPEPGSIGGFVWEDLCVNFGDADSVPVGCVRYNGKVNYVGNGIFEPGEAGIQGAAVSLGEGVCPSQGIASIQTGTDGRFTYSELMPGVYCVTVLDPGSTSGLWSYPQADNGAGVGHMTVTLGAGKMVDDVNFGWDRIESPLPPEPTAAPTAPACTDKASYVRDVSIPDGTRIDPSMTFTKTWRLRNEGTCTWTPDYSVVFVSGYSMQSTQVLPLLGQVSPGKEVDISVSFQAPAVNGEYVAFWKLRNSNGGFFGVGSSGVSPFWVQIFVGRKPEPKITEWRGEYYDNTKLSGDPVLVRNDKNIDFNWSNGSPDRDIPSDDFSTRWTRTLTFEKALYRFHLVMDDGAALWIDDQLVIDEWKEGASREVAIDVEMVKGKHNLKVLYYEAGGNAIVKLWWEKLGAVTFNGWRGMYWFNRTLDSKWALVRNDAEINFDWKYESPARGIPADDFSAQWMREVEFVDGVFIFYAYSDDGLRVYVDGVLVIDEWHNSDGSELYSAEMELNGKHELLVQYYERKQYAHVQFWWERKNEAPQAQDDEYSVDMQTVLKVSPPGVLENDTDGDGDALTVTLAVDVTNGNLTLNGDGSFEYSPNAGFIGEDSFQYRANDGFESSELTTVTITVNPLNHVPQAIDDVGVITVKNTPIAIDVLANDLGLGDVPLELMIESAPENGTVEVVDSKILYTPTSDFIGEDSFSYTVVDVDGESSTAIVIITVLPEELEP